MNETPELYETNLDERISTIIPSTDNIWGFEKIPNEELFAYQDNTFDIF